MTLSNIRKRLEKARDALIPKDEPFYGAAVLQPDGVWKLTCGNRQGLTGLYNDEEMQAILDRDDTKILCVKCHQEGYQGPNKPNYLTGKIQEENHG